MTVALRTRLCLPALLLMLAAAGCATQRPSPEKAALDGTQLTAPEALPAGRQQLAAQMTMGAHGEAYLAWMTTRAQGEDWEFRFSRSEDGGATWSGPLWFRKPAQGMFAEGIKLAAGPTEQVYLAWRERNANKTDTRILMTRSLDGGRHWEEVPRELAAGDHLGLPHLQAGPGGALCVAWLGGDESLRVLEVAASQDSGGTFAPKPARIQPALSMSNRGITNPRLAADDKGRLYAVWEEATKRKRDAGIYLSRSEDHGRTWSEPILVSPTGEDALGLHAPRIAVSPTGEDALGSHAPRIAAASDGQVYLIWEQAERRTVNVEGRRRPEHPIDRLIYFNRSLDGGRTWLSRPVRLSQSNPTVLQRRKSLGAQIVSDGRGHVYVALIEGEGTHSRRLVVFHSADSGATWAGPTELGRTSPVKGQPVDAVLAHDGDGRLWLIWQEHAFGPRYGWFVLMNRSEDHGQQWADQAVIMGGPTAGQTTDRDLLVSVGENGLVLAAWDHGARVYQPIALNRSTDGGKSWSPSRLPLD
ncbi:MAG: exo-alpha-sialidase [Candidatus Methylomirabilis oxyfera]|nr:exo-alpha-sialidase [Candidatus Methylomirabilis oxyfera]